MITAHNGYIETYLNGGVIGLCFLCVFIWSTGLIATAKLVERDPIGRVAVMFWPIILIYNLTESQFLMAGPVWYVMLLATSDLPQARRDAATVSVPMARQTYNCINEVAILLRRRLTRRAHTVRRLTGSGGYGAVQT